MLQPKVSGLRVPAYPPKPTQPITRLSQFRDGGYVLISHCSSGRGHQHVVAYDAAIAQHGDVDVDYDLKKALTCPECGAHGGGVSILPGL